MCARCAAGVATLVGPQRQLEERVDLRRHLCAVLPFVGVRALACIADHRGARRSARPLERDALLGGEPQGVQRLRAGKQRGPDAPAGEVVRGAAGQPLGPIAAERRVETLTGRQLEAMGERRGRIRVDGGEQVDDLHRVDTGGEPRGAGIGERPPRCVRHQRQGLARLAEVGRALCALADADDDGQAILHPGELPAAPATVQFGRRGD